MSRPFRVRMQRSMRTRCRSHAEGVIGPVETPQHTIHLVAHLVGKTIEDSHGMRISFHWLRRGVPGTPVRSRSTGKGFCFPERGERGRVLLGPCPDGTHLGAHPVVSWRPPCEKPLPSCGGSSAHPHGFPVRTAGRTPQARLCVSPRPGVPHCQEQMDGSPAWGRRDGSSRTTRHDSCPRPYTRNVGFQDPV